MSALSPALLAFDGEALIVTSSGSLEKPPKTQPSQQLCVAIASLDSAVTASIAVAYLAWLRFWTFNEANECSRLSLLQEGRCGSWPAVAVR